jgi:hypothetical protein
LVLDDLRRLTRPARPDDDLCVRQIGQGVDGRCPHCDDTGDRERDDSQHDKEAVGN